MNPAAELQYIVELDYFPRRSLVGQGSAKEGDTAKRFLCRVSKRLPDGSKVPSYDFTYCFESDEQQHRGALTSVETLEGAVCRYHYQRRSLEVCSSRPRSGSRAGKATSRALPNGSKDV